MRSECFWSSLWLSLKGRLDIGNQKTGLEAPRPATLRNPAPAFVTGLPHANGATVNADVATAAVTGGRVAAR